MRRLMTAFGVLDADTVWERYASLSEWSGWAPQISRVDASGPRLVSGLTGTVHGLFGVQARFEVLDVDEARRTWSWRVRSGPVTLGLHHAVVAVGEGTRTTLEVEGPGPAVLLYAPVAEVALRRLVRS